VIVKSLFCNGRRFVWTAILGAIILAGCQSASVINAKEKNQLDPSRKAVMHLSEIFTGKLPATMPATTSSPATAESKIVSEAVMAYFQAKQAISEKDYKGAITELKKAIEIDPSYLPAHTLLMSIAFEQEDTSLAAKHARIVLEKDPNDAMANYILGSTLLDKKEFDPGMVHLYRAMNGWNSKDGLPKLENLLAAFKLGGTLANQGYVTATIEVYAPLLEELEQLNGQANIQDPRIERMVEIYRPGLYMLLGELSLKLKQYPQALNYYERAQKIPSIENAARLGAVKSHIVMGNKKEAGILLDQAAQKDISEPVIELYKELYPKGWPDKVISMYRPSEKNIDLGLRIVRELQKAEKYHASISLLKKIRTIESAESQSIWYLVKAYDAIGQTNQAALTLLNSVATNPNIFAGIPSVIDGFDFKLGKNLHKALLRMDVAADKQVARTFLLGLTAQFSHNYGDAEKYYKQTVQKGDRFLPAYVLWGNLLYMQRNWSAAIALMDQAISKNLKTGSIYFIKGRSYAELNNSTAALVALEQARKLNPESDQIMLALVEVYLQSNDSPKAIALLKELIGNQVAGPRVLIRMTQILLDSNTNDLAEGILQNYLQRFGPDDEYDLLSARLTFIKDQEVSTYREKLLKLKDKLSPGVVDRDLAELEYNVSNFTQAGNIAEDALASEELIEPDNYQRLLQISALAHWKLLEYEIAENAWLQLIHDWPSNRVSEVALARMYMDWQNYAKGLPLIESLLATEKDNQQKKEFQTWLISCYIEQNRVVDGLNVIDQWLVAASSEDRVRYLQMKVNALVEQKMFDEALAVTEDLIQGKEQPVSLWQQSQVMIYMQNDQPEKALAAIDRFIAVAPDDNRAFMDGLKIEPLLALKKYDQAIAIADSLVQAVPKDKKISAVLVLIQCYQQAGRYDQAIDFAKKQLSQYPESSMISVSLHQQIVRTLEFAGRFNEAEKYILIQHDKSEGEVKNQWQQFLTADYFAAGRLDRAIKLLETILSVNPNLGWANNSLGYALANHGKDYKRAEALIRKAVATEPGLGAYLDSLGWVLYRQGKYEQAYQYTLMSYRSMAEPDPIILDHLGDICYALKKYDRARQYWQESIRASRGHDATSLEPEMPERTIKKLKRLK
jgi:tetratricopeptide (TPR) repeat protein